MLYIYIYTYIFTGKYIYIQIHTYIYIAIIYSPGVGRRSYPKVGRGETVRGGGGGGGGGGGVGEVSVDVGQQVAHHRRDTGAHVLGGQAGEMPARSRG